MNATETKNALNQEIYAINESLYALEQTEALCSSRAAAYLMPQLTDVRAAMETRRADLLAQVNTLNRKIPAVKWTIVWSESSALTGENVELDGWDAFAATFARIRDAFVAEFGSEAQHYDKTKYCVEFADGETYTGRVDVNASEWHPGRCMRDFLTFYAGTNKPKWMSVATYAATLKDQPETVAQSIEFLERYEIVA